MAEDTLTEVSEGPSPCLQSEQSSRMDARHSGRHTDQWKEVTRRCRGMQGPKR